MKKKLETMAQRLASYVCGPDCPKDMLAPVKFIANRLPYALRLEIPSWFIDVASAWNGQLLPYEFFRVLAKEGLPFEKRAWFELSYKDLALGVLVLPADQKKDKGAFRCIFIEEQSFVDKNGRPLVLERGARDRKGNPIKKTYALPKGTYGFTLYQLPYTVSPTRGAMVDQSDWEQFKRQLQERASKLHIDVDHEKEANEIFVALNLYTTLVVEFLVIMKKCGGSVQMPGLILPDPKKIKDITPKNIAALTRSKITFTNPGAIKVQRTYTPLEEVRGILGLDPTVPHDPERTLIERMQQAYETQAYNAVELPEIFHDSVDADKLLCPSSVTYSLSKVIEAKRGKGAIDNVRYLLEKGSPFDRCWIEMKGVPDVPGEMANRRLIWDPPVTDGVLITSVKNGFCIRYVFETIGPLPSHHYFDREKVVYVSVERKTDLLCSGKDVITLIGNPEDPDSQDLQIEYRPPTLGGLDRILDKAYASMLRDGLYERERRVFAIALEILANIRRLTGPAQQAGQTGQAFLQNETDFCSKGTCVADDEGKFVPVHVLKPSTFPQRTELKIVLDVEPTRGQCAARDPVHAAWSAWDQAKLATRRTLREQLKRVDSTLKLKAQQETKILAQAQQARGQNGALPSGNPLEQEKVRQAYVRLKRLWLRERLRDELNEAAARIFGKGFFVLLNPVRASKVMRRLLNGPAILEQNTPPVYSEPYVRGAHDRAFLAVGSQNPLERQLASRVFRLRLGQQAGESEAALPPEASLVLEGSSIRVLDPQAQVPGLSGESSWHAPEP